MSIDSRSYWLSCKITEEERDKLFLLAQDKNLTVSDALAFIVRQWIAENDTEAK